MEKARLKVSRPAVLCVLAITGILMMFAAVIYQRHVQAAAQDLDTPVVLIGGSLTCKRGLKDQNNYWQEVTKGQEYVGVSSAAVTAIVIKAKAADDKDKKHHKDDGDPTTDKPGTSPILTGGNPWTINAFVAGSPSPAFTIKSPDGKVLDLKGPSGTLCPDDNGKARRIGYSSSGNCSNQTDTFTQVVVDVTGQPSQTISCVAATTSTNPHPLQGKCRLVLRAQ